MVQFQIPLSKSKTGKMGGEGEEDSWKRRWGIIISFVDSAV